MDTYAIFLDVDGTLTDWKGRIPESAKVAIKQARKNGHYVFLSTGRCKAELYDSILDIGFDGIIGSSGGYIEYEGEVLRHYTFDNQKITELRKYFEAHKIGYYLECNHGMYVNKLYKDWSKEFFASMDLDDDLKQFDETLKLVTDSDVVKDVNKISFVCLDNNYDDIYADLRQDYDVIQNTIPSMRNVAGEISLKGVHKADAIQLLLNHLNLDVKTIGIGDSDNDIEMLQHCDIGVAVNSGKDSIKAIADEITDAPEEDGIYKCFVKHKIIESEGK